MVFRTPANFQFVGRGGSAASQTRNASFFLQATSDEMRVLFYMVICVSVFAENWGWRSATERTSSIAPEESPLWGVSAIHRTKSSSLTPFAYLSMFRLPKLYCALRSQHLLSQMHSLSITPELYSGTFPQKSTFIKISLPLHLPNLIRVKDQGRTKDEPRNTQRTPYHPKSAFY